MKKFDNRLLWGLLLVAAGVLFFLQNLNLIPSAWDAIWALFLGAAGVAFMYAYLKDRSQWWAIIPGLVLIGLALLVLGDQFWPKFSDRWGGGFFLGMIALSFWVIYVTNREMWWAIIPGGVLTTLAGITVLEYYFAETETIFFLGLAVTFLLVALLPTDEQMRWAFIPAAALGLIALLTSTSFQYLINYLWPVALIVAGGYVLWHNFRREE
jgi:hypothetical protein